jgi:hypothetical protein
VFVLSATVSATAQTAGNEPVWQNAMQHLRFEDRATETGVIYPTAAARSRRQDPILRKAIEGEARRQALSLGTAESSQTQQPPAEERAWMRRHPALFGALMGAGAAAVSSVPRWTELYCAGGGDEDCLFHGAAGVLFGVGAGAGIGALIGFLAGR